MYYKSLFSRTLSRHGRGGGVSLVPEGFDGIQPGRFPSGVVPEEDPNARRDTERRHHRADGRERGPAEQGGDGDRDGAPEEDADRAADEAQQRRLEEELEE